MVTARRGVGQALARAALAGNPSDGYRGAVLAVTIRERSAQVEAVSGRSSTDPPSDLIGATRRRFARKLEPAAETTSIRWSTTIPRSVGLGGSSAIVIATLRALCDLHGVTLGRDELARFALAVEVEELGIAAGLQDRVAQAYGELTFMDFAAGHFEPIDPALLPPLIVAWRSDAAGDSGAIHADLRARSEAGDQAVSAAMTELGSLARAGRDALLARDHDAFARSMSASYEARRRMMALDERHVAMIEVARACGAGANFAGSGGAIVACCRDAPHGGDVAAAMKAEGWEALTLS
jgi:glucuronokinase